MVRLGNRTYQLEIYSVILLKLASMGKAKRNPPNHDEYQTRIRPSAFGVDLDTY